MGPGGPASEGRNRIEAVVNWLETQYPSPAFPTRREDIGEPTRGDTRYYSAYGAVKRGYPILLGLRFPAIVLDRLRGLPCRVIGARPVVTGSCQTAATG